MRVDTRIAVIGIIVEDKSSADGVNGLCIVRAYKNGR